MNVGDRVKYIGTQTTSVIGKVGTIRSITSRDTKVLFDGNSSNSGVFANNLELLDPPIYTLIKGGYAIISGLYVKRVVFADYTELVLPNEEILEHYKTWLKGTIHDI